MSSANNYRIVVLGSGGVGKSALTLRLISDEFAEEYDPTIEDSYRKQVLIDNKPALLDVLDTAGQEEYASLQDQWIREGDGYLLVYSITNEESLTECHQLIQKITRIRESDHGFPLVLAGNKCDLTSERRVKAEDAKKKLKAWADFAKFPEGEEGYKFFETSAKTKVNTQESFHEVVRLIRKEKEKSTKIVKKKSFKCNIL